MSDTPPGYSHLRSTINLIVSLICIIISAYYIYAYKTFIYPKLVASGNVSLDDTYLFPVAIGYMVVEIILSGFSILLLVKPKFQYFDFYLLLANFTISVFSVNYLSAKFVYLLYLVLSFVLYS